MKMTPEAKKHKKRDTQSKLCKEALIPCRTGSCRAGACELCARLGETCCAGALADLSSTPQPSTLPQDTCAPMERAIPAIHSNAMREPQSHFAEALHRKKERFDGTGCHTRVLPDRRQNKERAVCPLPPHRTRHARFARENTRPVRKPAPPPPPTRIDFFPERNIDTPSCRREALSPRARRWAGRTA